MDAAVRHDEIAARQGFQDLADHRRRQSGRFGELGRGGQAVAAIGHLWENDHAVIDHAAEFQHIGSNPYLIGSDWKMFHFIGDFKPGAAIFSRKTKKKETQGITS